MSAAPPAAKVLTMRTGRAGQSSARAAPEPTRTARTAAATRLTRPPPLVRLMHREAGILRDRPPARHLVGDECGELRRVHWLGENLVQREALLHRRRLHGLHHLAVEPFDDGGRNSRRARKRE